VLLRCPTFSPIPAPDGGTGGPWGSLNQAFESAGAQARTTRLTLLLGLFAVLLVIRAVIRRNIALSQLQMGFVETVRTRLAQRLGAPISPGDARVRHPLNRATHAGGPPSRYLLEVSTPGVAMSVSYRDSLW